MNGQRKLPHCRWLSTQAGQRQQERQQKEHGNSMSQKDTESEREDVPSWDTKGEWQTNKQTNKHKNACLNMFHKCGQILKKCCFEWLMAEDADSCYDVERGR